MQHSVSVNMRICTLNPTLKEHALPKYMKSREPPHIRPCFPGLGEKQFTYEHGLAAPEPLSHLGPQESLSTNIIATLWRLAALSLATVPLTAGLGLPWC